MLGRGKKQAFNLLELLIVIAILAILLALLLPGLAESRRRAQRTVCLGLYRQYASALALYGYDYDDFFPTPETLLPDGESEWLSLRSEFRSFWKLIAGYLPVAGPYYWDRNQGLYPMGNADISIPARMLCPGATASFERSAALIVREDLYEARPTREGVYETALIRYDSHPAALAEMAGGRRVAQLPSPSRYFFMNDTGFNDRSDDREFPYWRQRGFLTGQYYWGHGCYYNVVFLDGHAEGLRRKRRKEHWSAAFTRVLEPM